MLIAVAHETIFEYSDDVAESAMEVRLTPAATEQQAVRRHHLEVAPRARLLVYRDYFGTTVHFFTVPARYRRLAVVSNSVVEVAPLNPFDLAPHPERAGEEAPAALYDYLQFGGPVGRHPDVARLAAGVRDDRPRFERLQALNHAVHGRLRYQPLVTQVDSSLADALALGQGVCQDFAHLMIGVCRELEVPARYVSGYLVTRPRDGTRGGGASHAWCECYLPGTGWRGFDPTNDLLVDEHYVQLATGRDYRDVPPTKGMYRGSAREAIRVAVRTEAVEPRNAPRSLRRERETGRPDES